MVLEESDELIDVEIQTDNCQPLSTSTIKHQKPVVDEDRDLLSQLSSGKILHRNLEQICGPSHAVAVRRNFLKHSEDVDLDGLPFQEYNYNNVFFSLVALIKLCSLLRSTVLAAKI